jgi:hypothetical protein
MQAGRAQVGQRRQRVGADRALGRQRVVDVGEDADQSAPRRQRPLAQGRHQEAV